MNLNITTLNGETDADTRDYVEKKIGSLSRIINLDEAGVLVRVDFGKTTEHHHTGNIFKVDVSIEAPGHTYRARAVAENSKAAIDIVKDDLAREIKTRKEKSITTNRKGDAHVKNVLHADETR